MLFGRLPPDAATEILSWLPGQDVAHCESVSKLWRAKLSPKVQPISPIGAIVWKQATDALTTAAASGESSSEEDDTPAEAETLPPAPSSSLTSASSASASDVSPKTRYLRAFCRVKGLCPYCYRRGTGHALPPGAKQKPLCMYFSPDTGRQPTPLSI